MSWGQENPETSPDWKVEANRRIEQYRKSEVSVTVTQNGKPVKDVEVKVMMKRHKFIFGSDILLWGKAKSAEDNEKHNRLFADLFNAASLTTYWVELEKTKGTIDFAYMDKVTAWCRQNEIFVIGTPLYYVHHDPIWAKDVSVDDLWKRQLSYSKAMPRHFDKSIGAWVVCNEFSGNSWQAPVYRRWSPKLGQIVEEKGDSTTIKANFAAARKGNPKAVMIANDNNPGKPFLDLLNRLKDKNGKPVYDAIGLQSHQLNENWNNEKIWSICESLAQFGVPLYFTENTIMPTKGEDFQADETERFYTMLFSHPAVEAILWWDFVDMAPYFYNGKRNYDPHKEGLPPFYDPNQLIFGSWEDKPGGLLHSDLRPKPVYNRLKRLIKEDWATNTSLITDANGKATVRAFHGSYTVELKLPDGTMSVREFEVGKDNNNWSINLSSKR
jgi:GH35 family endo-1,4-beta-xylanase